MQFDPETNKTQFIFDYKKYVQIEWHQHFHTKPHIFALLSPHRTETYLYIEFLGLLSTSRDISAHQYL